MEDITHWQGNRRWFPARPMNVQFKREMMVNIVGFGAFAELTEIVSAKAVESAVLARVQNGAENLNREVLMAGMAVERGVKKERVVTELLAKPSWEDLMDSTNLLRLGHLLVLFKIDRIVSLIKNHLHGSFITGVIRNKQKKGDGLMVEDKIVIVRRVLAIPHHF